MSEANSTDELAAEAAAVLDSFERATGLWVCVHAGRAFHDRTGRCAVPAPYRLHRSPFCLAHKNRDDSRACKRSDTTDLLQGLTPGAQPFVRTCHAGAMELIIPLYRGQTHLGIGYVGQFTPATKPSLRGEALPRLAADEQARLLALGMTLRSYLLELAQRVQQHRRLRENQPTHRIQQYIDDHLAQNPTLGDLAAHLSLSVSRTGHLVREKTGMSFSALKDQRRLRLARHLLEAGHPKIAWVALQCGFEDANYFCRFFKQKAGETASAYRARHAVPGTI